VASKLADRPSTDEVNEAVGVMLPLPWPLRFQWLAISAALRGR
jgi:hypothetical protein